MGCTLVYSTDARKANEISGGRTRGEDGYCTVCKCDRLKQLMKAVLRDEQMGKPMNIKVELDIACKFEEELNVENFKKMEIKMKVNAVIDFNLDHR